MEKHRSKRVRFQPISFESEVLDRRREKINSRRREQREKVVDAARFQVTKNSGKDQLQLEEKRTSESEEFDLIRSETIPLSIKDREICTVRTFKESNTLKLSKKFVSFRRVIICADKISVTCLPEFFSR